MEIIPKERIQNLMNITYSMINDITSIENSLNNISMIIGRGTAIKTHIEESKAPPQPKPEPVEEKEIKKGEVEPQSTRAINPMEALVNLINEKKSISISEAAKTLNFDTSLVETWAKLLNDNNKIKIEYRLVGNPILKVK